MVDKLEKREIKFRAWDTELKMMVYENEQTGDTGYETNPIHAVNSIINEDYAEYIWMQHTGLKDKDGVKIYEGDIISFYNDEEYTATPTNGLVIYDSGAFMVEHKEMGKEYLGELDIEEMYVKVVGNIHDNPELLKE